MLMQSWYDQHPIRYLLAPLSAIYRLIISIRYWLFRLGIKKVTRFSVPVIVVGNITVGGTGKTPLVIWLANLLQQKGFRPGIVSRGYGGIAKQYPQWVTQESDPTIVSDEAVLLAQKTKCPVMIAPNRVMAVKDLLTKSDCNIILSDDGLQHYALARDIEIAVIDGKRRFGNGFCLPAGPLREPKNRIKRVDFTVTNGGEDPGEYQMQLIPDLIYNLRQPDRALTSKIINNQQIHAVAGIGNPERFFNSLRLLGYSFIEHPFPDHHLFQKHELEFGDNTIIIMTEKDAVKCKYFADDRYWCLPIKAELPDEFSQQLLKSMSLKM
jgi:tetraacyldisaccharide 4'-kinase